MKTIAEIKCQNRFSPHRLRLARLARGKSTDDLAEEAGCTRQAISLWENGDREPTSENLACLARLLDVPIAYFAERPSRSGAVATSPVSFRSLRNSKYRQRLRAEGLLGWIVLSLEGLERTVGLPSTRLPSFDVPSIAELTDSQIDQFAEDTRRFFGLGDGPISNVTKLLENFGVWVGGADLGDGMDGLSAWFGDRAVLLVSSNATYARGRFDVAHELAHLVLHRAVSLEELEKREAHAMMEDQANRFASAFLLPESSLAMEFFSTSFEALIELKARWGVSMQAILYRARDVHLISENQYKWAQQKVSRNGYRKVEPLDKETKAERPTLVNRIFESLGTGSAIVVDDLRTRPAIPLEELQDLLSVEIPSSREEFTAQIIPFRR